jgi:hypothetical protein
MSAAPCCLPPGLLRDLRHLCPRRWGGWLHDWPLGALWQLYTTGKLQKNVNPPIWQITICAGALVFGLATYGHNVTLVTRAMGVRLAKLSPSRGICAELATAIVIMVAAQVRGQGVCWVCWAGW